ncbi:hypothetical protein O4G76_15770 [Limimaricola sp. G21655-S1]|uniref:Eco57I restriction-modification methylase domain-containing protein n=1 Tax=Limimaricola sp. G21655-S1 TaxID=3014768 RepID=UPI0022AF70A2|nr:DNA methyltransferase [Limimaricola sp. G21655-S1]MCZ4262298.1 hypothetical protein [Limimaricola sp. G21655-S1]
MNTMSLHGEWLSLIDISGPFLAEPVLKDVFPQGLDEVDVEKRRLLRQAYEEWRDAIELGEDDLSAIHQAWVDLVLRQGLELDEDGAGDVLKAGNELPEALAHRLPEYAITLSPDYAVVDDRNGDSALMLIKAYAHDAALDKPLNYDGWAASPAERMVELCRATGTRLGLVTNGEQWMLVDAPVGAVTTFASWYASLWSQEPKTLQAFVSLLGVRRFFTGSDEQLPALLDESLKLQDEVTDALGEQVRRAVEVLIQALDRADLDINRELLAGVEPTELYEAGLTVMMRIVFLLSAEERDLLLLGDETYETNYAISTLRLQLRAESEEILERRYDAWSRLLAIFRAVYGGVDHEEMRLPALGGSLFDPDRFPFLEGRLKGSHWRADPAKPLPIDNRTVLLLLDAVQLFQGRTLSYRELDVEQIGYVYEGLLERTVVRAKEVTLDLDATKSAKKPWVTLDELEEAAAKSADAIAALLKERTGSSHSRVKNDLKKAVDAADADRLLTACHGDQALRNRIKPYLHLLRTDRWGYPLAYPIGTFMVTTGTDRRETGTHYTPKSLTDAIVKETLEPLVYVGPAEGKPREEWKLKSPSELLDLKICDPAMGSGAFLVQVCRWLAERLVEAWREAEANGNAVSSEGIVVEKCNGREPLREDPEERMLTARRLIGERCLYGVDVNPLAVELAKLSIWLITLAKGRPFGFLDHNLRSGDSLLGIHDIDQLLYLEMKPGMGSSRKLFASNIDQIVKEAIDLRLQLRRRPIRDIRDVEAMAALDEQARQKLALPELIADALIGEILAARGKAVDTTSISIDAGRAIEGDSDLIGALRTQALEGLGADLTHGRVRRYPFHWPLEFPEVFQTDRRGFDAVVGNPPFMGCKYISESFGDAYFKYLAGRFEKSIGRADLVVQFFLRAMQILNDPGFCGLIGTKSISQGDTKEAGLQTIIEMGGKIYCANKMLPWPGTASVVVSVVHFSKGHQSLPSRINGEVVTGIDSSLSLDAGLGRIAPLAEKSRLSFIGYMPLGEGFVIDGDEARALIESDRKNIEIVKKYLTGKDFNTQTDRLGHENIIDFGAMSIEEAEEFVEPLKVIRERVKPYRDKVNRKANREKWWQFAEVRPGLRSAIAGLDRVLVVPIVTKHINFAFADASICFSNKFCIIPTEEYSVFALYQSSIHFDWVLRNHTTLGKTLNYTPKYCFETFPDPQDIFVGGDRQFNSLGRIGLEYHNLRDSIQSDRGIGLTGLYNLFHSSGCSDEDICSLRRAHRDMDQLVFEAYDWGDLVLDYEFAVTDRGEMYSIAEPVRDKVAGRLIELNRRNI